MNPPRPPFWGNGLLRPTKGPLFWGLAVYSAPTALCGPGPLTHHFVTARSCLSTAFLTTSTRFRNHFWSPPADSCPFSASLPEG